MHSLDEHVTWRWDSPIMWTVLFFVFVHWLRILSGWSMVCSFQEAIKYLRRPFPQLHATHQPAGTLAKWLSKKSTCIRSRGGHVETILHGITQAVLQMWAPGESFLCCLMWISETHAFHYPSNIFTLWRQPVPPETAPLKTGLQHFRAYVPPNSLSKNLCLSLIQNPTSF